MHMKQINKLIKQTKRIINTVCPDILSGNFNFHFLKIKSPKNSKLRFEVRFLCIRDIMLLSSIGREK